jgi:hypothetical protein
MTGRRDLIAIAAVCAAVLLATGAAALAKTVRFDSKVTIHAPESGRWTGRVFSDANACVPNRTVKVFRKTPSGEELVGADQTDSDGRYEVFVVGTTRYYARVTRRVIEKPGRRIICRADESKTITGA